MLQGYRALGKSPRKEKLPNPACTRHCWRGLASRHDFAFVRHSGGFELTPEYKADVAVVMTTILPVRPRADGAVFDMFISNADINAGYPAGYPLEEIAVPVLIVSAVDDPLTLYANAKAAAGRIPGAKLVTIEDGGHMLLGHEERIRSEIVAFLEEYSSTGTEREGWQTKTSVR